MGKIAQTSLWLGLNSKLCLDQKLEKAQQKWDKQTKLTLQQLIAYWHYFEDDKWVDRFFQSIEGFLDLTFFELLKQYIIEKAKQLLTKEFKQWTDLSLSTFIILLLPLFSLTNSLLSTLPFFPGLFLSKNSTFKPLPYKDWIRLAMIGIQKKASTYQSIAVEFRINKITFTAELDEKLTLANKAISLLKQLS